jgi:hypothetical protein
VREKAEELARPFHERLGMTREELVAAIEEGINSGTSAPMTQEDWELLRREVRERLARASAPVEDGP